MLNKDIQLCGIGNAIVDIQFEVDDKEIKKLQLDKGTMTLVGTKDHENVNQLMGNRTKYKSSGGSAANTIIAFSSFGGKSAYKTMLGADNLGDFYRSEFQNLGIVLDAVEDAEDHTGISYVLITPDSERTMLTNLGATIKHGKQHIKDEIIKRSEWLYVEGYKLSDEIGYEAVMHAIGVAKKYDTKVALTFSDKFIIDLHRDRLNEILKQSDLFFCNELEAKTYTNCDNVNKAYRLLKESGANFAMTKGPEGSNIYWEGTDYEIPAYDSTPVDSTGAGDMYAGGFFYGLLHGNSLTRAGHLGSISAARVVSQHGARLRESHTDLKERIFTECK